MIINGKDIMDKNNDQQVCQWPIFFNNLGQDECAGLAFKSCTIPNLFNNVTDQNNILSCRVDGPASMTAYFLIIVPIGNWSMSNLGGYIEEQFNDQVGFPLLGAINPDDPELEYRYIDRDTSKFGFRKLINDWVITFNSGSKANIFNDPSQGPSTIWNLIGHSFSNDLVVGGTVQKFTFTNYPQMNWMNTIYITADRLTPATGFNSAQQNVDMLESVDLSDVPFGTVAYKEANVIYDINFPDPRHTNAFVISLRDRDSNLLYLDQASVANINIQIRLRLM